MEKVEDPDWDSILTSMDNHLTPMLQSSLFVPFYYLVSHTLQ